MKATYCFKVSFFALVILSACDSESPVTPPDIVQSGDIQTVAGSGPLNFGYEGDGGWALEAKLGWVTGIVVDHDNNVYLTDGAANTVRKITASNGNITTIAGSFRGFNVVDPTPFAGDGGPATQAHLNIPIAVTVDADGEVFIADAANHVVRRVDDEEISTLVGVGGVVGYAGDGGQASSALLYNPNGLAVDQAGNIYFADSQNNVVRKVNAGTGIVTTIAGLGPSNAGYTGDNGPATAAKLNNPYGVAVDSDGNIYISDSGNNVIRKIVDGVITTIAGTGEEGYSGDGGAATSATFLAMKGIVLDRYNNIFVADAGNNVIRKITEEGIISTHAGNGQAGYNGDNGPAEQAQLNNPWGVAVDEAGNVYIADTGNSVVRFVAR
jgi:sugar lactone lactonase YvrE